MSEQDERYAEMQRLFMEFKRKLMPLLPERYPEMQVYERWRALILSYLSEAEYCAKHASDKLHEKSAWPELDTRHPSEGGRDEGKACKNQSHQ